MNSWRSRSFGGKNSTGGVIPDAVKSFMNQQNKTVGSAAEVSSPKTNLDYISSDSPLSKFTDEQRNKITKPNIPKILLAAPGGKGLPLTNSLVEAIKATNREDPLASLLAGKSNKAVESIEKKQPALSGEELAAEEFMASLANPLFKQMPVDKSLVAALKSMNGAAGGVLSSNPKFQLLPGLQKRKKRSLGEVSRGRSVIKTLKSRIRKSVITKPMERSNMVMPVLNSQQGPKLMDKIRDMGRVIATP